MLRPVLCAALAAAAVLATAWSGTASADDGPPPPHPDAAGRPPATILRPSSSPKQLILLVGGLASQPGDGSFDVLLGPLAHDDRFDVRRFGAAPGHPYDSTGAIDPSARALIAEIRDAAPRYAGVHLVTHSMGGNVADRAFALGLSGRDNVRSYVALAAPHDGSVAARVAVELVAGGAEEVAALRPAGGPIPDPTTTAVRDLARARALPPPAGVTRLDLRLATDQLVLGEDARTPGVDARTLLPRELSGLEGHGGILRDPRAAELVRMTIVTGAPPLDRRAPQEHALTAVTAALDDRLVRFALAIVTVAVLGFAGVRRMRRVFRGASPFPGVGGQAVVEFALVLPLLLAVALGIAILAQAGVARLALQQAAAEGARAGALTNDDALIRTTIAAAVAPLDPARLTVAIEPAAGEGDRAGDPRGALLFVRLAYPLPLPVAAVPALTVRGAAARRIEWTP